MLQNMWYFAFFYWIDAYFQFNLFKLLVLFLTAEGLT